MALDGILSTGGLYTQNSGFLGSLALGQSGAGLASSLAATSYTDGTAGPGITGAQAASSSAASQSATGTGGIQGTGGYSSTSIQVDSLAGLVVTQFRDPQTGTVEFQIPSKQVVETYRLRSLSTPPYNPYQIPSSSPKAASHSGNGHGDTTGGKTGNGQQYGDGSGASQATTAGSGTGTSTTGQSTVGASASSGGGAGDGGTGSDTGTGGIAYSGGPTVAAGVGDGTLVGAAGASPDNGATAPVSAGTASSSVNLVA